MTTFIGRDNELAKLQSYYDRGKASLIVVCGRRRIGKSTLVEHSTEGGKFLELYGLSPRERIKDVDQLQHFSDLMAENFGIQGTSFPNWTAAFNTLAKLTANEQVVILLDEISWMAGTDKDFAGKLKGVWDTKFKKNPNLTLILCGSVTSWIEDNILNDKGYVGRVSLTLKLTELPLYHVNQFWDGVEHVSSYEKLKVLCVTGGVPRYLEEIDPQLTAEQNIKRLCYSNDGFLFLEFDKIFRDIFETKAENYKRIVQALVSGPLEPLQLCDKLGVESTGALSKQLKALVSSGFICRDYVWDPSGKMTNISRYRLCDNYLRFYLKYLEPKRDLIEKGLYDEAHLENLTEWSSIMGLQFENLVFSNLKEIVRLLDIAPENIVSASPFIQHKTNKQEACQIDMLICTKYTIYICEIKFRKKIEKGVIDEVISKMEKIKCSNYISLRPVLIYQGELADSVVRSGFFTKIISFETLLEKK